MNLIININTLEIACKQWVNMSLHNKICKKKKIKPSYFFYVMIKKTWHMIDFFFFFFIISLILKEKLNKN